MSIYFFMAAFLCAGFFLWDDTCLQIEEKKRRILQNTFLFIAAAIFVLVATFRYGIGYDYFNYKKLYEQLGAMTVPQLLKDHVAQKFLGYSFFTRLMYLCGLDYHHLLFVVNIFLTGIVFWFIKKYSPLPWLGAYLYLTLQFFAHSMNLFRQSIAATICLLAYPFLKKRKILPFLFVVFVASSFHTSALFFLPFYWILNWKVDEKKFLLLSAGALPFFLFSTQAAQLLTQYLFPNYAGYIGSRYWSGLGVRYAVFPAIYFVAVWFMRKHLLSQSEENRILVNSSFYVLVLYVFSTHHMILERFSIYLFMYAMILLPKMTECFAVQELPKTKEHKLTQKEKHEIKEKRSMKMFTISMIVILGFSYMVFASIQGTNGFHKVYPYVSIWSK